MAWDNREEPRQAVAGRVDLTELADEAIEALRPLAARADVALTIETSDRVLVDGGASAVVNHPDSAIREKGDGDLCRVAGQRLVDGVVDHLVHEMLLAAFTGRADVHAWPLANSVEAFKNGDRAGVV